MPLAHSMDHPGPMAHTVTDLALLLRAMIDRSTTFELPPNYVESSAVARTRPRFGRLRQLFEDKADKDVQDMMDEVCNRFKQDGAELVEASLPAGFSDVLQRHRIVMAVEAAEFHEERMRKHPDDYPPRISELLAEGLACPAPEFVRTKRHQDALSETMRIAFYGDTILLCPATTGPAPLADTTGDPAFNSPWSYTGLPTISIQTGYFVEGLPLAIQLVAGPNREDLLFSVAAWCEKRLVMPPSHPKLPTA
jgi:aspartyl-tRNA(Asn)/glutamyl-tRNA(Gln) amidotransferase subunit A